MRQIQICCVCLLFSGLHCVLLPSCDRIVCPLGHTCEAGRCVCPPGMSGINCRQLQGRNCNDVVCPTGRECELGRCVCTRGSTASGCGSPSCHNVICPAGRVCISGRCVLKPDTPTVNPACTPNPCQQDCLCVPSCIHSDGYYCHSPSGFIGKKCNIATPVVACATNAITITILDDFVDEFQTLGGSKEPFLHLGKYATAALVPDSCKATVPKFGQYLFSVSLPFDGCGTNRSVSIDGDATFTNEIWMNVDGGSFDMPVPVLRFICSYEQEYTILASLTPAVSTLNTDREITVSPAAKVELCKVGDACPNGCPPIYTVTSGAVYTVAETIHVTMSIDAGFLQSYRTVQAFGFFVVIVEEMYLSCDKNSGFRYSELVSAGCETSELTSRINYDGKGNVACVSFKVPRLLRCGQPQIYIHAKLRIVDETDLNACSDGAGRYALRKKRFLFDEIDSNRFLFDEMDSNTSSVVVLGPIYILNGTEGLLLSAVFPRNDHTDTWKYKEKVLELELDGAFDFDVVTIPTAILGGIAFSVLIVCFYLLIFRSGYRCSKF